MLDFRLQLIFKKLPSVIAPLCHYTLVSAPYPHSLNIYIYIYIYIYHKSSQKKKLTISQKCFRIVALINLIYRINNY